MYASNLQTSITACTGDDDPSKPLQSNQLTHLQERLIKKLGPNAYPFYFEVHSRDFEFLTGNESVPKIIINGTISLFLNCNQHFGNFKP